ncbi:zinc finger protein ZXDC isoform X5 [Orcinus orca]|uniref:zinc finger protein ZXDC isoform X5 n=1 Tax=Orcinus orca TaxID=9733 RepID=UPI002111B2F8|nr:zinc finger protein ZXDC isoform X5 [Orcinus orca]
MDAPALLAAAAPAPRGPQLGGGPGRTRRTPGSAHRRLLLLRDPEDGAQGPRRGEARPAGPGGGDSFVVLLEVARGAAEAPGRRETEPQPGAAASPAGRPAQVPGAAPLVGPRAAGGQDLLVHLERGVLALAAPSRRPPPGQEAASPAGARRASAGPGYRCPEPQCALAFAKKHQLQVHLLTHGGGQGRRPFKCPLDGCGWAFTTSYKLKRHLQSHDKLRPFGCPVGGCGKKFTTVYNLRAHMKGHEQESLFKCEVCAERFPTHAKLSSHQRSHFEPERPYKCDFPGCEKTFITVSALFSHNRAHFREQELFSCSFPGCSKQYDKACRLKIHLRSHTGERPFICDSDSCGWTFTSMSKLLRHKRKHDEDRRFPCPVEGCGKSFTRAEHLKGHSVTHLGTKPFACPVEGCCARFSARSSLYIHSKKHLQDVAATKSRCPVSSCHRLFASKHSVKAHVIRQHHRHPDLFPPLGAPSALAPSSDLSSPGQSEFSSVDLAVLFSDTPGDSGGAPRTSDEALRTGILTVDVTSLCDVGQPGVCEPRRRVAKGPQEGGGSARTDSRAIQLAKEKKQRGAGSHTGAAGPALSTGEGDVPAGPGAWLWGSLAVPGVALPCVQVQLLQVRARELSCPVLHPSCPSLPTHSPCPAPLQPALCTPSRSCLRSCSRTADNWQCVWLLVLPGPRTWLLSSRGRVKAACSSCARMHPEEVACVEMVLSLFLSYFLCCTRPSGQGWPPLGPGPLGTCGCSHLRGSGDTVTFSLAFQGLEDDLEGFWERRGLNAEDVWL